MDDVKLAIFLLIHTRLICVSMGRGEILGVRLGSGIYLGINEGAKGHELGLSVDN